MINHSCNKRIIDSSFLSDDYSVSADDKIIPVYKTPVGSYTTLCCEGEVTIRVAASIAYEKVIIRPLSSGIRHSMSEQDITFIVPSPARLSIEFDGNLANPLFVFLYRPETDIPDPSDPKVHYYRSGYVYDAGLIELHDRETLYIEEGAIVKGVVFARDADCVTIHGRGTLNGCDWPRSDNQAYKRLMQFVNCTNLVIQDVCLVDGPAWHVVPVGCRNVTIKNINIISVVITGDGIDIVGSQAVRIFGCFIRTNDDCVAIKAVAYDFKEGNQNVNDVLVEHCVCWNHVGGNVLEIGFESRCDEISEIIFRDIDVIHAEYEGYQSGAVMAIHNSDRALVHDVLYDDIRIEDAQEKIIDLKILQSEYSETPVRGNINNIRFRDIAVVSGAFPPSIIRGYEYNHRISQVAIENFTVYGNAIRNAFEGKMVIELAHDVVFT